jgi:hypothetical protein
MGKEEALQNSLSDPALLHASLAHVAKTLSSVVRFEMNPNIIYHVGKAIAMVNKRIANSHEKPVSIDTIGAVTAITAFEVPTPSASPLSVIRAKYSVLLLAESWYPRKF